MPQMLKIISVVFAKWFLHEEDKRPSFPSKVFFFLIEVSFTREGIFNMHNLDLWSGNNPHVTL